MTDLVKTTQAGAIQITDRISLPKIFATDERTAERVLEFFAATIRNPNTRRAYGRAVEGFADFCEAAGIRQLGDVRPLHVSTWVESLSQKQKKQGKQESIGWSAPSIKQALAAVRMLFDWLVVGHVVPSNPAAAVRGPKYSVKKGKTPILTADEARALLDSIDTSSVIGLRDRALIALMTYSFARVGAAAEKMRVEDVYVQGRRLWLRLHEKGGKLHEMPAHHKLEGYLHEYLDRTGLADQPKAFLFQTMRGRSDDFTGKPMPQANVYQMIERRRKAAGILTKIGCHSFRATGITEYLRNGGKLEVAQQMANHESARTTGLYDRRNDQVSLDEVERILI